MDSGFVHALNIGGGAGELGFSIIKGLVHFSPIPDGTAQTALPSGLIVCGGTASGGVATLVTDGT